MFWTEILFNRVLCTGVYIYPDYNMSHIMIAGKYLYILILIFSSDILLVWIQGNGYFLVEFSDPNLYWGYFFYRISFACENFIPPLDLVQRCKRIHKNARRGAVGFTSPEWDPHPLLSMSSVLKSRTSSAATDVLFLGSGAGALYSALFFLPWQNSEQIRKKKKLWHFGERERQN